MTTYTRPSQFIPLLGFGRCPVRVLCITVTYPVRILYSFGIHPFYTVHTFIVRYTSAKHPVDVR